MHENTPYFKIFPFLKPLGGRLPPLPPLWRRPWWLPKDHCVQVPWKYIKVCGYSDPFCKKLEPKAIDPRWPLTPHLLRSSVWLYPRIIVSKSHENTLKYVDTVQWSILQITTYTHILHTYYIRHTEWAITYVSFWTTFRRDKKNKRKARVRERFDKQMDRISQKPYSNAFTLLKIIRYSTSRAWGVALTLEDSMGICPPQDPFFRPFFTSGDPPFQALFQLQRFNIYFLEGKKKKKKKGIFNFCQFWLHFSSWDPSFKNQFRRTYIWKPGYQVPSTPLAHGMKSNYTHTSRKKSPSYYKQDIYGVEII